MQSENTIGATEFARWDAVMELQLAPYDLDVVASTITHGPEETRCESGYCPKEYCGGGYQS
jgi:hypothetical protein